MRTAAGLTLCKGGRCSTYSSFNGETRCLPEPRLHSPRVIESNSDPLDPCAVQPQSSERDRLGEVPRRGIRAPIGLPFALPFFFKPTFFAADQFGLSAFQSDRTTPQILFVDDCDGCDLSITALSPSANGD